MPRAPMRYAFAVAMLPMMRRGACDGVPECRARCAPRAPQHMLRAQSAARRCAAMCRRAMPRRAAESADADVASCRFSPCHYYFAAIF